MALVSYLSSNGKANMGGVWGAKQRWELVRPQEEVCRVLSRRVIWFNLCFKNIFLLLCGNWTKWKAGGHLEHLCRSLYKRWQSFVLGCNEEYWGGTPLDPWITWFGLDGSTCTQIFFPPMVHMTVLYHAEPQIVVQLLSCVWLFAIPWTAACQASLSITNSRSLLKLMSIESVMPSNHLILCHPFLLLPSIFPSIRIFSNELVLCIRWPNIGVSASASVLLMNIQDWFPLGLTGFISL